MHHILCISRHTLLSSSEEESDNATQDEQSSRGSSHPPVSRLGTGNLLIQSTPVPLSSHLCCQHLQQQLPYHSAPVDCKLTTLDLEMAYLHAS